MELLKVSKDKRALKFIKKRVSVPRGLGPAQAAMGDPSALVSAANVVGPVAEDAGFSALWAPWSSQADVLVGGWTVTERGL